MDFKKIFRGLWRFTREIRSFNNDKQLQAQVSDGKASFVALSPELPENMPHIADGIEEGAWMLYREYGNLVNHQYPQASGCVHRQYWHCWLEKYKSNVYFVEARDSRHGSVKDPWEQRDLLDFSSNFTATNFFHDITFLQAGDIEFKDFSVKFPRYATDACEQFIKDNGLKNLGYVALCQHLCGNDYYSGVYAIQTDSKFSNFWHIHGPEKAFTITTSYSKVTGSGEIL